MAFAEHLAGFLSDFGVPCSKGASNFSAILDMPGELRSLAGVEIISNAYQLTMLTSDAVAAAIAFNDSLVVNGTTYTVRDVMPVDDGAFTYVTLSL